VLHKMLCARFLAIMPVVAVLIWSCGGETGTSTNEGIAGTYVATTFQAATTDVTVDLLAAGASLTLTLTPAGAVSGTLNVPDTQFGPGVSASMTGTYTRTGTTVRFTQSADTFVRDLSWTVQGNTLVASGNAGGGVSVTIVLTKQ
jgi:hypothetical protein